MIHARTILVAVLLSVALLALLLAVPALFLAALAAGVPLRTLTAWTADDLFRWAWGNR